VKILKLCVFPNDPLLSYLKKGEIKPRYFNPKNMFDEIHVISLFDSDAKPEHVKDLAGDAVLKIHTVGKTNILNVKLKKKKVVNLIREIKPDIIRSYNPLLQGWLATKVGKELGIPVVISLMGDYDRDLRHHAKQNKNWINYLKLKYSRNTLECFSIKNADEVIIIYEFIRKYAESLNAKNINLIYNKIDLTKFSPDVKPAIVESKPIIICVGRLMKEKNQEILIRAIKDMDVILLLIGDGPQYLELVSLVEKLDLKQKVRFERSIPNNEINSYYTSAKVFALPIKYGGFAIPALEAAASGIPVVLPKQEFDSKPEIIEKFAMLVDNTPESFQKVIKEILANESLRNQMIKNGLDTVKNISGDLMEEKEKNMYLKIIAKK
jgi:glycosyltransferase involved in cell wall biosynthesis